VRGQRPRSFLPSFSLQSPHPPPHAPRRRFLPRKIRSAENDRSTSRTTVSFTHTAEELVHESTNRSASTQPVKSLASPRSAGTVGPYTPGNLSFFLHHIPPPTFHWALRDAVQRGHAHPCVQCRKQPQAVGDLCLGCDSSVARSNETRLRELDLRDPNADSRMYTAPATQPFPLTILQLSPTSTVSGMVSKR